MTTRKLFASALLVLLLLGILVILTATDRWGIGVNGDSVVYLGAARSMLEGRGLLDVSTGIDSKPLTHYPPLFPLLLALAGRIGPEPLVAARWINSILFGLNILLTGVVARSFFKSYRLALGASLLVLVSFVMVDMHLMALAEPLFLFFETIVLYQLVLHLETGRFVPLMCAAISAGLGLLTRYAGVSTISTGLCAILLLSSSSRRTIIRNAVLFGLASSLPMLPWIIRNIHISGRATDRVLVVHPIGYAQIWFGLNTISTWLLPAAIPLGIRMGLLAVIAGAVMGCGLYLRAVSRASQVSFQKRDILVPAVMAIFVACYLSLILATTSFFDRSTIFDDRILLPLLIPAMLSVLWILLQLNHAPVKDRALRVGTMALFLSFIALNGVRSLTHLADVRRNGRGYTGMKWLQSAVVQQVKRLPPGVVVYSCLRSAFSFLTNVPVRNLPVNRAMTTGLTNPMYSDELSRMKTELQTVPAAVTCVDNFADSPFSSKELVASMGLQPFIRDANGTLYVNRILAATLKSTVSADANRRVGDRKLK